MFSNTLILGPFPYPLGLVRQIWEMFIIRKEQEPGQETELEQEHEQKKESWRGSDRSRRSNIETNYLQLGKSAKIKTKWLFAYSIYADNFLSAYSVYADIFLSVYSVQKSY